MRERLALILVTSLGSGFFGDGFTVGTRFFEVFATKFSYSSSSFFSLSLLSLPREADGGGSLTADDRFGRLSSMDGVFALRELSNHGMSISVLERDNVSDHALV